MATRFSTPAVAGGLQSVPQSGFPGGALIGCAAGFLNVPKIKGTHTAMKSGMLAADVIASELQRAELPTSGPIAMTAYERRLRDSWVVSELHAVRRFSLPCYSRCCHVARHGACARDPFQGARSGHLKQCAPASCSTFLDPGNAKRSAVRSGTKYSAWVQVGAVAWAGQRCAGDIHLSTPLRGPGMASLPQPAGSQRNNESLSMQAH